MILQPMHDMPSKRQGRVTDPPMVLVTIPADMAARMLRHLDPNSTDYQALAAMLRLV